MGMGVASGGSKGTMPHPHDGKPVASCLNCTGVVEVKAMVSESKG